MGRFVDWSKLDLELAAARRRAAAQLTEAERMPAKLERGSAALLRATDTLRDEPARQRRLIKKLDSSERKLNRRLNRVRRRQKATEYLLKTICLPARLRLLTWKFIDRSLRRASDLIGRGRDGKPPGRW
jgi:hypothetical protein